MSDIFHTFFGIAGLCLLGYFDEKDNNNNKDTTINNVISDNKDNTAVVSQESTVSSPQPPEHVETASSIGKMKSDVVVPFRQIDPTYALPLDIVEKLKLQAQKIAKLN